MGRIYALRMAQAGTAVAVLDRSESAMTELAGESPNIHTYPCDVTNLEQVQHIIANVEQQLGPIERLVHCAAIMPAGTLAEQPTDSIHQLMAVNYGGTVNVVRTVLPAMQIRNNGEIVIFGSLGGYVPVPDCGAYCASKAAVNCFAEILIEENRDSDVHIMLVCPPLVDTPLLEQATATGNPKTVRDSIQNKRFATASAMIDAVEAGLRRKTAILYPNGEAKILAWLRRFSPRMVWRIIHAANKA
jgi:short-subunit dehydrogenase